MKSHTSKRIASFRGFTLIELLVSMAVMALVLVLVSQIVGSVLQTTSVSHQRLDSSQRARAVLEAIGRDLSSLVAERGLTVFTQKVSGSDDIQMAFLTRGRPPNGTSPAPSESRFLAVDYRLSDGNLIRSFDSVTWSEYDLVGQASNSQTSAVNSSIVASGVLRIDAVAVLDDGTVVPIGLAANKDSGGNSQSFESETINGQDIDNNFTALRLNPLTDHPRYVRAIIVGVAVVDERAVSMLEKSFASGFGEAAGMFLVPDPGQTPLERWNEDMRGTWDSRIPQPVIASIYFAQSTFVLK